MNVVPSAGAARSHFYAGYIAFTSNGGGNDTYSDPLAANIDQPGAAEGSGHRHQTYEPVPLGFDIGSRQSCSGEPPPPPAPVTSQCTAPAWTVNQTAWQTLGGRTVGQTVNGRTAFGELSLGEGQIRIIGALLPMPTERYYHPYGLANYSLTYSGYQVLQNSLQVGIPTAVKVSSFRATATGRKGVTVSWRGVSEYGSLGYNVWRFAGGKAIKVNKTLIAAKPAERAGGARYSVLDRTARPGVAYTYRLQVVRTNGTRAWAASSTIRAR
jgi:hypothetical protein